MAILATTEWRVRTGGNNANGSAFDASQSGALSTTLSSAVGAGDSTISVSSATGWPSSGNYYARIGAIGAETTAGLSEIVLVTSGQGTTTWTVTRAQLGTSAIALASGVVVDNNLARCDTAAFSGTDGTSNASTTFTSASATFNPTVVGNYLRLASGTNGTVGYYRVTAFTDANTITLDRNCSTAAMTNGAWKIGGAAANVDTAAIFNTGNAIGNKCVAGNVIYIRGSGTRDPSAADYTMTSDYSVVNGDTTNGYVSLVGEYGRPRLDSNTRTFRFGSFNVFVSCVVRRTAVGSSANVFGENFDAYDSVLELANVDVTASSPANFLVSCHVRGHTSKPASSGSAALINTGARSPLIFGCLIENGKSHGVTMPNGPHVVSCLVRNCKGDGVNTSFSITDHHRSVVGCTLSGNDGHGINITAASDLGKLSIINNLIANHTAASKYAINGAGSACKKMQVQVQNNAFYNNTATYNNLDASAGDVTCTSDPFNNSASGDFTLNNTAGGGKELRDAGLPQALPGLSATDAYSPIGFLATPSAFIAPAGTFKMNLGTY